MWLPRKDLVLVNRLLLLLQIHNVWSWSWQCIDKNCVRGLNPLDNETPLQVCRLTCGNYGGLWPQPTGHVAISDKIRFFHPSSVLFDFSGVAGYQVFAVHSLITRASSRFTQDLAQMCHYRNCSTVTPETSVTVQLTTTSSDLTHNWNTDESYSLEIQTRGNQVTAQIQAETIYGVRHGIETLSQLIAHSPNTNQLVIVTNAKVSDKPAYPHRGLLLDTSRHYLPIQAILRTIDAMATVKLNVLHWHISDTQSFPLVLQKVPQLARYGAYSDNEVYTMAEMVKVVGYARARGVRILMELDMPAHAGNGWQWGESEGLGNLAVCVNQQPWRQYCLQPPCGQLNPANPQLYNVLKDVFREILDHMEVDAFHMGGDEVFFPCWNQTKEITDWMKAQGRGLSVYDFLDVWGDFQKKVLEAWDEMKGNSKTPIVLWTSHLTDKAVIGSHLDKDRYVIEAWTNSYDPLVSQLLEMGYRVIVASRDAWYLDHGFWGRTQYHNWRQAYDNLLPGRNRGMLGGEVAMWGELVDESNLDSRVWPRAAAAAERLWTDPRTDSSVAEQRMLGLRERLIQRGVQAEAIAPQWCDQNHGFCSNSVNTS